MQTFADAKMQTSLSSSEMQKSMVFATIGAQKTVIRSELRTVTVVVVDVPDEKFSQNCVQVGTCPKFRPSLCEPARENESSSVGLGL